MQRVAASENAETLNIQNRPGPLCLGFDYCLNIAPDFYLFRISHVQQAVNHHCGSALQLDQRQGFGVLQPRTVMINVADRVTDQSAGSLDLHLFCQLGETAFAERSGGHINLLTRAASRADQFALRFQGAKKNLPADAGRINGGERNFSWPSAPLHVLESLH
jgi:hypothetical protein